MRGQKSRYVGFLFCEEMKWSLNNAWRLDQPYRLEYERMKEKRETINVNKAA